MENKNSYSSTGAIPKRKMTPIQEVDYMDILTSKYIEVLHKEIENNEKEQNKLIGEVSKIREVMGQLKELSERPEWPNSFVQVNPLAYAPATIIHTGEHYVKLGTETYTLMSLNETLGFLQRKLDRTQEILDTFKIQHKQLTERTTNVVGGISEVAGTEGMPSEIATNKGVAHKTPSGFYEVVEPYIEEEEQAFYKRRLKTKAIQHKGKSKHLEQPNTFFQRLDELQKQEEFKGELDGVEVRNYEKPQAMITESGDTNIYERIRTILKQSGLYSYLLNDNVIQQHCHENKTTLNMNNDPSTIMRNESVLNELIVEALINEPVYLEDDRVSEDFNIESVISFNEKSDEEREISDPFQSISTNDLTASAFLDSIESNMKNWSL